MSQILSARQAGKEAVPGKASVSPHSLDSTFRLLTAP